MQIVWNYQAATLEVFCNSYIQENQVSGSNDQHLQFIWINSDLFVQARWYSFRHLQMTRGSHLMIQIWLFD